MPRVKCQRIEPTDGWEQLQLLTSFPEPRAYELSGEDAVTSPGLSHGPVCCPHGKVSTDEPIDDVSRIARDKRVAARVLAAGPW